MNAVLVISKVSLGVVAHPESAEDAVLASSPGAQGVRGECGQQRVDWKGRQRRLQKHKGYISSCDLYQTLGKKHLECDC